MKIAAARLVLIAAAAALAGCAIEPQALSPQVLEWEGRAKIAEIGRDQEPFTRPVNVYEAMARALKYNLEYRVESAQLALKSAELNLANYAMLPEAVVSAGYAKRNNHLASSSFNLETNTPNFGASTSQDLGIKTADLTFSWNILDFGLSYVRAEQAADRYLISNELRRRMTHRLLEDVRSAYWEAVSYERLLLRMRRLEQRMQAAVNANRALAKGRDAAPLAALSNEVELADMKRSIKELERGLGPAKMRLASLMNVRPGTPFDLDLVTHPAAVKNTAINLDDLIEVAVRDRPELRENLYLQRINGKEARAALLELLPGIQLYAGPQADSNSFLLNNDWVSLGAKASWNLLKVFQYPAKEAVIDVQQDLLRMRALALTMAVVLQVNVSAIDLHQANEELTAAGEHRKAQRRFADQVSAEAGAGRLSDFVDLREQMNSLISETKHDIAFARVQSAYSTLLTSIGAEPYGEFDPAAGVDELAQALKLDPALLIQKSLQSAQLAMQEN